jgi:hypothetical protein
VTAVVRAESSSPDPFPCGEVSAKVLPGGIRPEEARMASLNSANIDAPHEVRPFRAHGHVDVVTLGDFTLGRGVFEPGWRWSEDVRPIAGTDSCQARHSGICVSGQMTVRANDGTEVTYGPGDVFLMEPGHDAWTVGDEPCVLFDTGVAAYAKPA